MSVMLNEVKHLVGGRPTARFLAYARNDICIASLIHILAMHGVRMVSDTHSAVV